MSPRFVGRDVRGNAIGARERRGRGEEGLELSLEPDYIATRSEGGGRGWVRERQGGAEMGARVESAPLHLRGVVFCNGCYVSNLNREIRLSAPRIQLPSVAYLAVMSQNSTLPITVVIISVARTTRSHSFSLTTHLRCCRFPSSPFFCLSFSSPSVSASLFVVANLLHDSFYFRDVRGFLVYVVSRTYVRIYANQLAQSICHLWSTTILPGRPGNASLTEAESHPSGDVSLNSRVIAWTSEREREREERALSPSCICYLLKADSADSYKFIMPLDF